MTHERKTRHVPGIGMVAVEMRVHWAPGVEARPVLTDDVVDQQGDAFIDREAASAVERLIASLP